MGATHSSKNGGGSNHASPTAPDPSLATNVTGGGTTRCSTCGESYCPTTDLAKYGCRCQRHGGDGDIISQVVVDSSDFGAPGTPTLPAVLPKRADSSGSEPFEVEED